MASLVNITPELGMPVLHSLAFLVETEPGSCVFWEELSLGRGGAMEPGAFFLSEGGGRELLVEERVYLVHTRQRGKQQHTPSRSS